MSARYLATRIVYAVLGDRISLTEAFKRYLPASASDSSFIKELCYGCIRWYPRLIAINRQLLAKPLKAKDKDIEILIALGLYQLLEMRVPPHAAVAETVNVTQKLQKAWARGVVNAVLRNFLRQQDSILANLSAHPEAEYAHPAWFIQHLQRAWPDQWQAILDANNQHPPLTLRVNLLHQRRDEYLVRLTQLDIAASATSYSAAGITLANPLDIKQLPGFAAGDISVQDQAAQLAAELLQLQPGQRVLDACAAPGGKTAHILESQPQLATIVAIDKDEQRLARVQENLSRLKLSAQLICADANQPSLWWDGIPFDRILLDAPCSATGVIRRHPDIKFLRQVEDFISLPQQQLSLLQNLWPLLNRDGLLVYATCSVMPEENMKVIQQFLATQTDAALLPIKADWGQDVVFGRQILPGQNQMDGFFYSVLVKN